MAESYADEAFVDLVRVVIMDEVIKEKRGAFPDFGECAPGVVATVRRFFYDPKRWRLSSDAPSAQGPIVEVQCKDCTSVEEVAIAAFQNLVALKGDKWIIEVEGPQKERGKKK